MPIPTPEPDETRGEFITRCMLDDTMRKEYPESDQRYVVCSQTFEDSKKPKE